MLLPLVRLNEARREIVGDATGVVAVEEELDRGKVGLKPYSMKGEACGEDKVSNVLIDDRGGRDFGGES